MGTITKLAIFGLGRLGYPLAALFAQSGLPTIGIDRDAELVERLRAGTQPLVEPRVRELVARAAPMLTLTSDPHAAAEADASIVLVATPSWAADAAASSRFVEAACTSLCRALSARSDWRYHLIIISSTLWPNTMTERIVPLLERELGRRAGVDFGIAYAPEFTALGSVVDDFEYRSFVLIGSDDPGAGEQTALLYRRIAKNEAPTRVVRPRDAELLKIALNVYLGMKVAFANTLAQVGDRLGGIDLDAVADVLALDPRVGVKFLCAGTPYGGPCLPRDTDALYRLARSVDVEVPLARASLDVNERQHALIERYATENDPSCVAVLGLAFKAETAVTEASPAFDFVERLLGCGVRVAAYDPHPVARAAVRSAFGSRIACFDDVEDAIDAAQSIVIWQRDSNFAGIVRRIPADRRIIDPWGFVRESHPGLVRPGRRAVAT